MGLSLSCGCFKKQNVQEKVPDPEPEVKKEPDYSALANRNTSYLHAKFFMITDNGNGVYFTPELVLSGLPDDMHREYLKLQDNLAAYLAKSNPNDKLVRVNFINLYNSADAILSPLNPPVVPVAVASAATVPDTSNVNADQ